MALASTTAPSVLQEARALEEMLAAVVTGLDASVLGFVEAEAFAESFARIERLAQAAKTISAARVAEGTAFRRHGHKTASDWLADVSKCSAAKADRCVETAKRLHAQPVVEAALRAGELNDDQANAISAAADVDPTAETRMVRRAGRDSLRGLRHYCERVAAAARKDDASRNERHRRNRQARAWFDSEGASHFESSNTGAAGVIVIAALAPFLELACKAAKARGDKLSHKQLLADAFEMLCAWVIGVTPTCVVEGFNQAEHAEATEPTEPAPADTKPDDGVVVDLFATDEPVDEPVEEPEPAEAPPPEPEESDEPDPPPQAVDLTPAATVIPWNPTGPSGKLPNGNRIDVTVIVDHEALLRGHTVEGETCEIAGLGPVSVATVQALIATGDPFYAALIKKGEDLVAGVHLGRQPTALQRTAVVAKDKGVCAVAGCTNTICEVDHNIDWTLIKETALANLRLFCTQTHHPMKSAGGTWWTDDNGDIHITPPPGWGQEPPPEP